MVNKVIQKRREKLRDFIKALPPERVRMEVIGLDLSGEENHPEFPSVKNCQTAGCIAGWMMTVFPRNRGQFSFKSMYRIDFHFDEMCEFLGLPRDSSIFAPNKYWERGRYPSKRVNKMLDHLVETGEVDWGTHEQYGR